MKNKWLTRLLNLDLYVSELALLLLIVITFTGAVARYFFNSPFVWQEEVQLALIMWCVFLGGSVAFRQGEHIAIELLYDIFPPKFKAAVDIVIYIVVMAVLAFVTKNGVAMVLQFAQRNRTTDILHIPLEYIYSAIPAGCALMAVSHTIRTAQVFIGNIRKKGGGHV